MEGLAVPALVTASVIFLLTYVGILSERIHRTTVAVVGAVAMVIAGTWMHFYGEAEAVTAIDIDTITLLFGMMVLASILQRTGLVQYLAIVVAKAARGEPWRLMVMLGLFAAFVSMLMDNVTTIIIVAPVTLSIADVLGISAVPFLISQAVLSNIGGVATLIGDPPNILIASAADLSFNDFLVHLGPVVLVSLVVVQALLLFLFRRQLRVTPSGLEGLARLDARRALLDPKTARKVLLVLAVTILLYLVHDLVCLGPGLVAVVGAGMGLLWVRPPVEEILRDVHWDVLIFFLCLFVIVGGLEAAGVLGLIAEAIAQLTAHGMAFAALSVLWVSAIMSAVVDNIPFTIAMIPVIAALGAHGVNVLPLWWALALGAGFGGNGTPIGSTAGIVTVSMSAGGDTPVTFRMWLKSGSLAALASCIVASAGLFLAIEAGWF